MICDPFFPEPSRVGMASKWHLGDLTYRGEVGPRERHGPGQPGGYLVRTTRPRLSGEGMAPMTAAATFAEGRTGGGSRSP